MKWISVAGNEMNDRTVAWRDPDSSGATAGRCGAAGCVWAVGVGRVALLLWRGLALGGRRTGAAVGCRVGSNVN